jgi:hypothetical protein
MEVSPITAPSPLVLAKGPIPNSLNLRAAGQSLLLHNSLFILSTVSCSSGSVSAVVLENLEPVSALPVSTLSISKTNPFDPPLILKSMYLFSSGLSIKDTMSKVKAEAVLLLKMLEMAMPNSSGGVLNLGSKADLKRAIQDSRSSSICGRCGALDSGVCS